MLKVIYLSDILSCKVFILIAIILLVFQIISMHAKNADFSMPTSHSSSRAVLPFDLNVSLSGPIEFKPDLTGLGKEIGSSFATIGSSFGDIFTHGAQSFSDAVTTDRYQTNMTRGMSAVAKSSGNAMKSFNDTASGENGLYPELGRSFRGVVGSAINFRNVVQFSGLTALSFAISITGYYGMQLLWQVISQKVLSPKPIIVLPETKYGWWDRVKRWWNGYESPTMIVDASVKERLSDIEGKTRSVRDYNKQRKNRRKRRSYENVILCGAPGTGKTLFAKVLADRTDMDIVITTAASLLQSGVSGVKYFNDIMNMANKSKYGMILFIDEADALFVDRDSLHPDSDHYKVLSHILAMTGTGNNRCMLIAATNHAHVIDSAMARRFQERVDMPLPSLETRTILLKSLIEKEFGSSYPLLFSPEKIDLIALRVDGLSHAEIADMITSMVKLSYTKILSQTDVSNVIEYAMIKKQKSIEDKIVQKLPYAYKSTIQ